jgi:NAD(P)-dependent dehydrogenase (short-subunit alcohol dehydrogenase family)
LGDGFALGYATHGRGPEAQSTYEGLASRGSVEWVAGDLADPEVPAQLVGEVIERLGRLDVLVNNAGITVSKPALELGADDFDAIFSVDVRGAFLASVAAAKAMAAQGGVIVNITSVHEYIPRPGFALYAPAKAALGMLTRSLALELAPSVRVVAVAPGAINVERNVSDVERLRSEIPLGRAGEAEEVANLVAWLVSDEARYVTGVSYLTDGGLALQVIDQTSALGKDAPRG